MLLGFFLLPMSLQAETCGEIIDGIKTSFESAKKFCADKNNNHDYVNHNVKNTFNYRMEYREVGGNNRPVATQYENISSCYSATESCKSICAVGLTQQNLCSTNFRASGASSTASSSGSVAQLNLLISAAEAAMVCLDNSVLACSEASQQASRICATGEEGIFRSNSHCSGAVGDVQMYFRTKNCTSTDAAEVAAFNEAKEKMLEQLRVFAKESNGFGGERIASLTAAEKSCSSLQASLIQNKIQGADIYRPIINNARTMRQQLSTSGK